MTIERGCKNPTNGDLVDEINAEIARQRRTAKEVAAVAGIEYQTFGKIRANQRVVTYPELKRICDALDVHLETLLRMIRQRQAPLPEIEGPQ